MKSLKYIAFILVIASLSACEDKDYPTGTPEYDNHYYAAFLPNNNTKVSVTRNQAGLVKLPVQFYSAFTRSYDAVAHYELSSTGIAAPAIAGQDFNIVDSKGAVLTPQNGKYTFTFPQAVKKTDTIYVKLLNSTKAGTRSIDINIVENIMPDYKVDIFSTAFKRPLEIK